MKKYKRSYNEIWHERKRTIGSLLLLVAVFIAVVMGVRAVLDFVDFSKIRTILDAPTEQHKYENLVVENHALEQKLSRLESKVGQLNLQG